MTEREELEKQYYHSLETLRQKLEKKHQENLANGENFKGVGTYIVSDNEGGALTFESDGEWSGKLDMMGYDVSSDLTSVLQAYAFLMDPNYQRLWKRLDRIETNYLINHKSDNLHSTPGFEELFQRLRTVEDKYVNRHAITLLKQIIGYIEEASARWE